jgi:recombination associated protein RdgC
MVVDQIQQKTFLGTEFATWLWFRSEQKDPTIQLDGGETCEVVFEKDLILASEAGQAVASALKGESPSLAPEAVAALMAGKKVKRAKVSLVSGNQNWTFTLNGETFDWSSLKMELPPSLPFDEAVPVRLNALEEFHRLFSLLFETFLRLRLDSEDWGEAVDEMRDWVASKGRSEEDENA